MRHVYLGSQNLLSFSIFACFHLPEKAKVLFDAAVPPGTVSSGLVDSAAPEAYLLLSLIVDVGKSLFDKFFRPLIQLIEVIGSIELLIPLETKPLDIFFNGIYIFGILFRRVRVVIAEIGLSAIFLG